MARHRMPPSVGALALTFVFAAQPAFAGEEGACEERYDMLTSSVTDTLDRQDIPWVTPTRFDPGCNCFVPRTRFNPCEDAPSTFSVRRLVRGSRTYIEFQYPSVDEIAAGAEPSGIQYRLVSAVFPDALQEHADPGTAVAAGGLTEATWCPPPEPSSDPACEGVCDDTCGGTCSMFSSTGVDVPADVGEAAGSNPLILDLGGDDTLIVLHLECEFE